MRTVTREAHPPVVIRSGHQRTVHVSGLQDRSDRMRVDLAPSRPAPYRGSPSVSLAVSPRTHIPALDGIRGIAILLVLVHHSAFPLPVVTALDQVFVNWTLAGWVGVDLFFVLSGFLITGILLDAKGAPSYFRNFYARRVLRIFPLYYAAVTLLVISGMIAREQGWYWAHGVNVFSSVQGRIPFVHGHFWSLAVEEQFYLVWPLCVWALTRRRFRHLVVGIIVGAAVARSAFWAAHFLGWVIVNPVWLYTLTPLRADGLAMGALVALVARDRDGLPRLRTLMPWAGAGSVIVIALLTLRHGHYQFSMWDVQAAGYTANALGGAALIICALTGRPRALSAALRNPILRSFGKYSYCLYIVHPFVSHALELRQLGPRVTSGGGVPTGVIFIIAVTALSYAISWVSWKVFEAPILSLKRYFETSHSRTTPPSLPVPSE